MVFKKGESGNPAGKPSGARDKRSVWKQYVDPKFPQMLDQGIQMALEGNVNMLQLFLVRGLPKLPKDELDEALITAQVEMLEARTAELTEIKQELAEIKAMILKQ